MGALKKEVMEKVPWIAPVRHKLWKNSLPCSLLLCGSQLVSSCSR